MSKMQAQIEDVINVLKENDTLLQDLVKQFKDRIEEINTKLARVYPQSGSVKTKAAYHIKDGYYYIILEEQMYFQQKEYGRTLNASELTPLQIVDLMKNWDEIVNDLYNEAVKMRENLKQYTQMKW